MVVEATGRAGRSAHGSHLDGRGHRNLQARRPSGGSRRSPGRVPRGADAHCLADVRERGGRDRARLVRAGLEDALERGVVAAQLGVALAHRRQPLGHLVADGRLEVAVAQPLERALDLLGPDVARDGEDLDQVGDAGLAVAAPHVGPRVGHGALELAPDRVRIVEHVDRSLLGAAGRGHLALGLLQVAHAGADLRDPVLGHDQRLPEALVETARDVAHQLEVLALVLSHRHLVRAVGQHVGGLQHGVHQQARGDELALRDRLVAELVHAVELAERGDRAQQPRQLRVLVYVTLAEQDAAIRVQPGGDQRGGRVVDALAQPGRVVLDCDRVEVDDAVDRRVRPVLALDVLDDRPDVVAEVLATGRLDPGEDDHADRRGYPARALASLRRGPEVCPRRGYRPARRVTARGRAGARVRPVGVAAVGTGGRRRRAEHGRRPGVQAVARRRLRAARAARRGRAVAVGAARARRRRRRGAAGVRPRPAARRRLAACWSARRGGGAAVRRAARVHRCRRGPGAGPGVRARLAGAVACALLRVEAWPFVAIAGLVLWRGRPQDRALLAALAVAVPAAWLVPELIGSGDLLRSGARARVPNPGQPALASVPGVSALREAVVLPLWPLWIGVAALLAAAAGAAWIAIVALMAQAGFSGEPRYALPGAALIALSGAVGATSVVSCSP